MLVHSSPSAWPPSWPLYFPPRELRPHPLGDASPWFWPHDCWHTRTKDVTSGLLITISPSTLPASPDWILQPGSTLDKMCKVRYAAVYVITSCLYLVILPWVWFFHVFHELQHSFGLCGVLWAHPQLFVMIDFPRDADMKRSPSPTFLGKTNEYIHDLKGIKMKHRFYHSSDVKTHQRPDGLLGSLAIRAWSGAARHPSSGEEMKWMCLSSYSTVLSFHSNTQDVWDYCRRWGSEGDESAGRAGLMRGRLQVTGVTGGWNQLLVIKYEVWKSTIQGYILRLNEIWIGCHVRRSSWKTFLLKLANR